MSYEGIKVEPRVAVSLGRMAYPPRSDRSSKPGCFTFQNQFMASTEPFALKSPHVWSFFDDAMSKAIHGSQGALELVNFIFLFMHKLSRSSTVCPPMMPSVAYSFPRPLWESKCRRDTGLVLHCAARQKDFSSPAEA